MNTKATVLNMKTDAAISISAKSKNVFVKNKVNFHLTRNTKIHTFYFHTWSDLGVNLHIY